MAWYLVKHGDNVNYPLGPSVCLSKCLHTHLSHWPRVILTLHILRC